MFRWPKYTVGLLYSLLGFFLLVSMRDDVAEWLVVNVARRVDGSKSKGLFHLQIYETTVCPVRISTLNKSSSHSLQE